MGLENPTYVNDLVDTNPGSTDLRSQGDDHIRGIKTALKNTFPGATKPFYFPHVQTLSSNTTLDAASSGGVFRLNANGGGFNVTLPEDLAAEDEGWVVHLFRSDDSANEVTIVGTVGGFEDPKLVGEHLPVTIGWTGDEFIVLGPHNLDTTYSVAAANSTPIGRQPSVYVEITGNTNINSFGKGMAGQVRIIRFTGTPQVNHDTSKIVTIGTGNLQMGNNYHMMVVCVGDEKWIVIYARDNNGESL